VVRSLPESSAFDRVVHILSPSKPVTTMTTSVAEEGTRQSHRSVPPP
jgi:hypothetical protein